VASLLYPGAVHGISEPPFRSAHAVLYGRNAHEGYSRDHLVAGVRAYNRWLAAYVGAYPKRLKGLIAVLSYENLDEAIDLIKEGADLGLDGGIMLPDHSIDLPGIHDRHWDRLWEVCVERNLPVNCHGY